jgi:transcriptional regulator with XRE-family HTH domain
MYDTEDLRLKRIIARTLLRAREKSGISQRDLAIKMYGDVKLRTYVSRIENNRATPTLITFFKYAKALEISAWKIIEIVEKYHDRKTTTNKKASSKN